MQRRPDHYSILLLLPFLLSLASCAHAQQSRATAKGGEASISYNVSVPDLAAETFVVTAELKNITPDTLTFYMPVWGPGAYDIVNFGAFVSGMSATSGTGNILKVIQVDTNTWKIPHPPAEIHLRYNVHDIESLNQSPWFGLSEIEDSLGVIFANGPALFGYPDGYKNIPYTVTYTTPPNWKLAVALEETGRNGLSHTFHAPNYDDLVDAPVQMGTFQEWTFEVDDIPHTVTVTSPTRLSEKGGEEVVKATKNVVRLLKDFYGEIPYDRYVFQYFLKRQSSMVEAFGALEHANSSTYQMPYVPEAYLAQTLMPVISHEYWHLWSPKRFHVNTLGPFDYQHPPATTSLWFHEGITDYYANVLLIRNHMMTSEEYFNSLFRNISLFYGEKQSESITTLSRELPHRPMDDIIGLYTKGPVIGLLLDAEIRLQTDNHKSLDDAMKYFNREYGDHHKGKTFGDDDIVPIIEKATGAHVQEFYNRYIAGTEPLSIDEIFPKIGLKISTSPNFGARVEPQTNGWIVRRLYVSGSMRASGIEKGDRILSFVAPDGKVTNVTDLTTMADQLDEWIGKQNGKGVKIRLVRDGEEMTLPLNVSVQLDGIVPDESAPKSAQKLRKDIFGLDS